MVEHGPPDIPPPATEQAPPSWGSGLDPSEALALLDRGGVAIWAIAALSVVTVTIILWKLWRLMVMGVWRRARAARSVALWLEDERGEALALVKRGHGVRARTLAATMSAIHDLGYDADLAREEATRAAKDLLSHAKSGLRALELIAAVAPLLGLFGTVLGMIAAFQALEETGARADPAALAGGIWEALLTTAAGMAVAIPAAVALAWFEAVIARLRRDMEGMVSRVLTHTAHRERQGPVIAQRAAE
ncbi:MAG: MotA/TolQ/ExbB proton channel family protein [Pseudomonadota bacterium]